jgi:hypothetical protein
MPYRWSVDPVARRGRALFDGSVAGADVAAALDAIYADPRWAPGFDALWDCSGVREVTILPQDVAAIAARVRALAGRMGPGRAAIVVPGDMNRLVALLILRLTRNPQRARRVFGALDEAAAWLDEGPPVGAVADALAEPP